MLSEWPKNEMRARNVCFQERRDFSWLFVREVDFLFRIVLIESSRPPFPQPLSFPPARRFTRHRARASGTDLAAWPAAKATFYSNTVMWSPLGCHVTQKSVRDGVSGHVSWLPRARSVFLDGKGNVLNAELLPLRRPIVFLSNELLAVAPPHFEPSR